MAFALPDVARKPLPLAVTEAVAKTSGAAPKERSAVIGATAADPTQLVAAVCGTSCHSLDVLASQKMDEKGWNALVQNMVARGAQASDAQVRMIVKYLAQQGGK